MKIYKIFIWILLFVTQLNGANNRINVNAKDYFIFGANLAWIDGAYRCDFGYNEVWGWGPNYNTSNVENYLEDLKNMGVKVIRPWIFEAYEGLMFNSTGYVTNIHPTLYNNMDDFVLRCENKNLYVYFCLISYLQRDDDPDAWKYLNIITNTTARSYYINNAVVPFVTRYKDTSCFFAIDIMNEPEFVIAGDTGNWSPHGTTWTVMRSFISDCVSAIKSIDSSILISCGSGWHNEENIIAGYYSGLGLDFYDYHKYDNQGNLIPYSSLGINKPCIIGECGQSSTSWNDNIQDTADKGFMNNAWNLGYAGVLFWQYNYPGATEVHTFVNSDASWRALCYSIKEFYKKHCPDVNIGGSCINLGSKNFIFYFDKNPFKIGDINKIHFILKKNRSVKITLYSLKGEKIYDICNGMLFRSDILHTVEWNAKKNNGKEILQGMYILNFKAKGYNPESKPLGVIK